MIYIFLCLLNLFFDNLYFFKQYYRVETYLHQLLIGLKCYKHILRKLKYIYELKLSDI